MYIVSRWIVALYFLGWLIFLFADDTTVVVTSNSNNGTNGTNDTTNVITYNTLKRLIFLTNWGFLTWSVYLFIAAAACTMKMVLWIWNTAHGRREPEVDPADHLHSVVVTWSEDRVAWYQKVHWVVYTAVIPLQFAVVILYWTIILPFTSNIYNALNFHVHLLNGVFAAVDLLTSGILVSIYHMYGIIFIGVMYVLFSGIYDAFGGTNVREDPYIYNVLDYTGAPGLAVGLAIATVFVFVPILYLIIYALAAARRWLSQKCRASCYDDRSNTSDIGTESVVPLEKIDSGHV